MFVIKDENGVNHPVFTFVQPLRSGRLLDTPREAARFVSLIGYDRHSVVGNTDRTEMWTHTHAFLARNCGVRRFCFCKTNLFEYSIFPSV